MHEVISLQKHSDRNPTARDTLYLTLEPGMFLVLDDEDKVGGNVVGPLVAFLGECNACPL